MSNPYLYTRDFPKQHKHISSDIINFFHTGNWEGLSNSVVCRDKNGIATAHFGQDVWNLQPYARNKSKNNINFKNWDDTPELKVELKLLTYGWMHHKVIKSHAPKFSTVYSRVSSIKIAFIFLKKIKAKSLKDLSKKINFDKFKEFLISRNCSQSNSEKILISINKALLLEPWLKYSFGFLNNIETRVTSRKISSKIPQQTLTIPERLSDEIYGKAIEIIENALPYKNLIADIESKLQKNYLDGESIVKIKLTNGSKFCCFDEKGKVINSQLYATLVQDHLPLKAANIISEIHGKIKGVEINNASDFGTHIGKLITACYIVCGAFSGMRESEIEKITPNSYYKENINGRDFHMLQSSTFKLGEKRETWITAPFTKKAIELMTTLSDSHRTQVEYPDDRYKNTLWCHQRARSQAPVIITQWSKRLKFFCRQHGCVVTQEDYQECIESNPNSINKIKKYVIIGEPWPLTVHQFRRSLAFYTIKYRLGTKVALKQQFKHLCLSMTEWYTNGGKAAGLLNLTVNKKIQQTLNEINAEMIASKIFKLWNSDEPLSGSMGKAIVKMRSDIPSVYSSWESIYQAVKKGTLTLHGTAHSYCKNGYNCDMDGVVMPQFCVDCASQGSIIDKEQASWWKNKHDNLVDYMELGEEFSVVEKSHYITQIRAAENVMTDFNISFTPFEPEFKVTNL